MTEDSGIDPLPDWFADTFGKWKDFIITGLSKEDSSRSYQMPLLTGEEEPLDCSDESDSDSHDDDAF
ncbi:hypothetical protein ATANTOWER_022157 [Ataeniobius toweri]|uniref:Uncharacterized protein n=1 Tax=Ataeniobius toweri TaxID=208326 RepID=A0ABU7C0F4_9TELE|nr:hypothetical protein [Ataeniobius toweri]